jgi:hypothetical protein
VFSFTPQLLYPQGKSPWYPLDRRLGGWGFQKPVWVRWWREKFTDPARTQTTDHPAHNLVLYHWAILASLHIWISDHISVLVSTKPSVVNEHMMYSAFINLIRVPNFEILKQLSISHEIMVTIYCLSHIISLGVDYLSEARYASNCITCILQKILLGW